MSAAAARAAAVPAPRRPVVGPSRSTAPARTTPPTPRLRPVAAPAPARSRVPFVLLCMAILASALLGALLLNTAMAGGAYEAARLQAEIARLAEREQDLAADLEQRGSPENLARAARKLGMVPAPELAFLRLSDGTVLGNPTPARGDGGGARVGTAGARCLPAPCGACRPHPVRRGQPGSAPAARNGGRRC